MAEEPRFERAKLSRRSGRSETVDVHFNPSSLKYTLTNTLNNSQGNKSKQHVSSSSGKLSFELVFDTTDTGQDVRATTEKIAAMMEPDAKKAPAVVLFEWGAYKFQGIIDSYTETLDFFSANGVPLRASISLSMSRQDKVFERSNTSRSADTSAALSAEAIQLPPSTTSSMQLTATRAGAPDAARVIGAANGLESLRFPSGPITLDSSIELKPPAAFATGGAGLSFGAGFGLQSGSSFGAGASLGLGVSAGSGVSASFGGGTSAGVSAGGGAFAGLRVSETPGRTSASLDLTGFFPATASARLATDRDASFSVGGKARIEGPASLKADVGVRTRLQTNIRFD